jgi:hypothetical protein
MECFNYARPDWTLLEAAIQAAGLPLATCGEFMWMGEWREGEHSYKHRDTRQYVRLRKETVDGAGQVRMSRRGMPQ